MDLIHRNIHRPVQDLTGDCRTIIAPPLKHDVSDSNPTAGKCIVHGYPQPTIVSIARKETQIEPVTVAQWLSRSLRTYVGQHLKPSVPDIVTALVSAVVKSHQTSTRLALKAGPRFSICSTAEANIFS
ncbi:hypothetical protein EVAR_7972_1 [Eumeta japonica]|uniref:Uncharacterized protein n=1 Tax=Eumeta variegata TaxID=151549 RepID=A0A4C1THR8_EUMVA|nr:hypothetical protein EVAR_7972_1 [Eumeta japonica]